MSQSIASTFAAQPVIARSQGRTTKAVRAAAVPSSKVSASKGFVQRSFKGVSRQSLSVTADARAEAESLSKGRIQYFDKPIDNSTSYFPQWPNKPFIAEVVKKFPDAGICSAEEARVLFSEDGYYFLDIRSDQEVEDDGRCPGATNVPLITTRRVFNSESTHPSKKDTIQTVNPDFLDKVQAMIPQDGKVIVVCSDGTQRAIQVLMLLDEAGYKSIVGVKGGFNAWFRTFDMKLNRRREDGYKEDFAGMGETACGIHGTGASFKRMDALDKIPLKDHIEWVNWAKEMKGGSAPAKQGGAAPAASASAAFTPTPAFVPSPPPPSQGFTPTPAWDAGPAPPAPAAPSTGGWDSSPAPSTPAAPAPAPSTGGGFWGSPAPAAPAAPAAPSSWDSSPAPSNPAPPSTGKGFWD